MQNLNQSILLRLSLFLPPLDEQRRIVAKVDQLMVLVDRYEAQLATARDTATQLLDALVAELTGTTRRARTTTNSAPMHKSQLSNDAEVDEGSPGSAGHQPGLEAAAGTTDADDVPTPASRAGARRSQDDDLARLSVLLRERGSLSSSEAQAATNLDPATLRGLFKVLIDQRQARTEGQRRGMRYLPATRAAHVK